MIYGSNWIPRDGCLSNQSPPRLPPTSMVWSLLSATGGWNETFVRNTFDEAEAKLILSIPIGSRRNRDEMI